MPEGFQQLMQDFPQDKQSEFLKSLSAKTTKQEARNVDCNSNWKLLTSDASSL